jgi:hypothetical protein
MKIKCLIALHELISKDDEIVIYNTMGTTEKGHPTFDGVFKTRTLLCKNCNKIIDERTVFFYRKGKDLK